MRCRDRRRHSRHATRTRAIVPTGDVPARRRRPDMRFVFYTHSLVSDWNHGNAHFLRGIMSELLACGHATLALEPADGWSRTNLLADGGPAAVARFAADFPTLESAAYGPGFNHAAAVATADVVVVHEWTDQALVGMLGRLRRAGGGFTLLFHDTHHRGVSDNAAIADLVLADYDAVLAFGETLRALYLRRGWGRQVFTWHEAADTRLFHPLPDLARTDVLTWIGNWGGRRAGARTRRVSCRTRPVRCHSRAPCTVCATRRRRARCSMTRRCAIAAGSQTPMCPVPSPRPASPSTCRAGPMPRTLKGIPTIRVFEALACGIPLVCAPWHDTENLFRPGEDFLTARDGAEMQRHLRALRHDDALADSLSESGLATIRRRHTCAHRVTELFEILAACGTDRVTQALATAEHSA